MSRRAPRAARARCRSRILTLVWGCNWPMLKLGVTRARAAHVPRADAAVRGASACCWSRDGRATRIRIPRAWWRRVACARVLQHRGLERLRPVRRAAAARGPQRDHSPTRCRSGRRYRHARAARAARSRARSSASRSACAAWSSCSATTSRHPDETPFGVLDDPRAPRSCGRSAPCCCASGSRRWRRTRCPAG